MSTTDQQNPQNQQKPAFENEIAALTALWNQLYGDVMYRINVPMPGEAVHSLLCDRLREHGLTGVREGIIMIGRSKYLMGGRHLPPVSLPWLLRADHFKKVRSGFYDDYRT